MCLVRARPLAMGRTTGAFATWERRRKKMKGLIGKKVGMTQVFDQDGNMVPVTVIDVSSCIVVGKRTAEKDKYSAVQLGFGEANEKKLNKPAAGHVKKS